MKKVKYPGHKNVNRLDGSSDRSWFEFLCGHCNTKVSGAVLCDYSPESGVILQWLECPECGNPSVQDSEGNIHPGVAFGPDINGLPSEVEAAYDEARRTMSVNAFTACELICRKILMHVAVDRGADEGESFAHYLDHLANKGYITPPMQPWVDLIRRHGNESTHQLGSPDRERAESTIMFTAELLRLVYEMQHFANLYSPVETAETSEDNS